MVDHVDVAPAQHVLDELHATVLVHAGVERAGLPLRPRERSAEHQRGSPQRDGDAPRRPFAREQEDDAHRRSGDRDPGERPGRAEQRHEDEAAEHRAEDRPDGIDAVERPDDRPRPAPAGWQRPEQHQRQDGAGEQHGKKEDRENDADVETDGARERCRLPELEQPEVSERELVDGVDRRQHRRRHQELHEAQQRADERIGRRADDEHEDARPGHLRRQREEPRDERGREEEGARQRRGLARADRRWFGEPRQQEHERADRDVETRPRNDGSPYAEARHEHEARGRGADRGAGEVQRVEPLGPEAPPAEPGQVLGERRQRRAHHDGGRQQQPARDEEAEHAENGERELELAPDPGVERLDEAEEERQDQRREADADLEKRVEPSPVVHRRPPSHPPAAEREAAHEGGEHGGDGERRGAEHVPEQPRPHDLVDEARAAGEQEDGAQHRHHPLRSGARRLLGRSPQGFLPVVLAAGHYRRAPGRRAYAVR
ncbi:MAG: hypothetical protein E6J75_07365 [Deltaproteobacteria bacterium]|nr:MAG: hypothetical protein E6J75_07365 [Deltaproteobacteria bacterium]